MSRFRTLAAGAIFVFSAVTNMATNLVLHAVGIVVLLVVPLVPSLRRGVDRRLAGQPRHGT